MNSKINLSSTFEGGTIKKMLGTW